MPSVAARMWLVAGGVCAGALVGPGGTSLVWWSIAVAGAALAGVRRAHGLGLVGLVLVSAGVAAAGAHAHAARRSAVAELAASVPSCRMRGRVLEQAGGLGTLSAIDSAECEGFEPATRIGVVVSRESLGPAGNRFVADGWLVPLTDDRFDAARRALGAEAVFDARDVTSLGVGAVLHRVAASFRSSLEHSTRSLDPAVAGLMRGLTVGDIEALDYAVLTSARRSGLAHLLAVSGSNVAIVLGAILYLTVRAPLLARALLAALGLMMFVLVVGPDASVLRAGVMGAIGLLALTTGSRPNPLAALGLAIAMVVGARPGMVQSVGLHLSAAATAGIVLWSNPIAARLRYLPRVVSLAFGVTLAAQVAVAPLLVGAFGELSLVGPVANLVAMPAVPFATILGLASGLAGMMDAGAGTLAARLAEPFVAWIGMVAETFGTPGWAAVSLPGWAGWLMAGFVVAAGAWWLARTS
jgi:competence protein ComEC